MKGKSLKLQEILAQEGVEGALVSDGEEVLLNQMPNTFTSETIATMIEVGGKTIIGTRIGNFQTNRIVYRFQNSLLLVQHVNDHVFLFVLCQDASCLSMLNIYINIVVDEIQTYLGSMQETVRKPSLQDVKHGGMEAFFERLSPWLANVLGPVATIVLDEAIESWIEKGQPSPGQLPELFAILDDDLPEEAKSELRAEFGE